MPDEMTAAFNWQRAIWPGHIPTAPDGSGYAVGSNTVRLPIIGLADVIEGDCREYAVTLAEDGRWYRVPWGPHA